MTGTIADISVKNSLVNGKIQDLRRFPLTITFLMGFLIVSGGRIHELFPILMSFPVSIGDLTGGGVVICFIFEATTKGIGKISLLREEKFVIGILVLGIVTIPTSVWPGGSIKFLTGGYLKTLVLFFLMTMALRTVTDLRKMVWAFLISIFFIGLMSAKNQLTHGTHITNTYDPNDIALVMVCGLPFTIYFLKETQLLGKILVCACCVLALLTIVLSESRGGFLGLVAIGGYLLFKAKKGKKGLLIITAIAGVILISHLAPSSYWDRISTIWSPQSELDSTGAGRLDIWKAGLKMFSQKFITGVGINNYHIAEGLSHFDEGGKWSTAHNSFLQIGAELGIVGLVLFVLLTFGTVLKMRKLQKFWKDKYEYKDLLWLTYAVETGMVGYIVSGFFLSQAYFNYLYFFLGLSVAMQRIASNIDKESELNLIKPYDSKSFSSNI